ncbi:MAG TPA: glycosyltransferase [Bryobacteraceae bacterium]|nr:glycosyltransferase [Bryobacteraceae bacterium]
MAAAALSLAVWLYLLLGRGFFWRLRERALGDRRPGEQPSVVAVIPARNEAAVVGQAIASLAAQEYGGPFRVVLVDDGSTDGTAEAACAAAGPERLTVVQAAPLEPGWSGKLWAVAEGVRHAQRFHPEFLLLTDADIVHPPGNVRQLALRAAEGYDVVSYMARLHCRTAAERALIPAFVFFFFMLYPPAWIADPRRATAGAAGGCLLIRAEALERIGGIAAIAGEWIDDCALARAVKRSGGRVWLGLSEDTLSLREYATFGEMGRMISRTAFTQLGYSAWLLAGTVAGLALTYLAPPVAALAGGVGAAALGSAAWLAMSVAYWPAVRFYRQPVYWAPLLPLAAAFYLGATVHSAVVYWCGRGGEWKGRRQERPGFSRRR